MSSDEEFSSMDSKIRPSLISRRVVSSEEDDPDKETKAKIKNIMDQAKQLKSLKDLLDENKENSSLVSAYNINSEHKKMLRMISDLENLHSQYEMIWNKRNVMNPMFIAASYIRPKISIDSTKDFNTDSIWLSKFERELISFKKDWNPSHQS